MQHQAKVYITLLLLILIEAAACKKAAVSVDEVEELVSPATGTRNQFTLDSIFLYAKQIYLWNDVLPAYSTFNPRQKYAGIASDITAFKQELFDISQLKINPVTGKAYEAPVYFENPKYSYLQSGRSTPGTTAAVANPTTAVLATQLIASGSENIGYIALGSFPALSSCKASLDEAFARLATGNPKNLVVDLRSNGGGYLATSAYVASLIAPNTLNGKIMYSEQFNAQMQNSKASILKHQPYLDAAGKTVIYKGRAANMADVDFTEAANTYRFDKKGTLQGIQNLYFIVSGNTASASEMLISCFKPYLNVKLIGERTYGKPVGFFAVNIDQYSVYLSSFVIKNAAGWSDYFNGMQPDVTLKGDAQPDLGNPAETCLNAAIQLINGNRKLAVTKLAATSAPNQAAGNTAATAPILFDMQVQRLKLKP
ncbi:S41 family peptidase [Pedobacter ghigonis]|uniref:S41 family peptidase n=1 Tax=Pedobacter ghigonis TaxID=2730403 RepID=UPI001589AE9A|nr:S41 family peptidase [Pedobacter ghigonis]